MIDLSPPPLVLSEPPALVRSVGGCRAALLLELERPGLSLERRSEIIGELQNIAFETKDPALAPFLAMPFQPGFRHKPSGGVPAPDADTVLLVRGLDSLGIVDSSSNGIGLTVNGSVAVDTGVTGPMDVGSLGVMDSPGGASDEVLITDDAAFDLGDYTIDFWIRWDATANNSPFDLDGESTGVGMRMHGSLNTPGVYVRGTFWGPGSFSGSTGTWYHIAITRSGSTNRFFKDGTVFATTLTNGTALAPGGTLAFFTGTGSQIGDDEVNGQISHFRVSDTARWTANFTAPSSYTSDY